MSLSLPSSVLARPLVWGLLSGLCCLSVQTASADIIPADRRTVWNPGIPGGVPARTTVCATVNASTYGNGSQNATGGIQAAIDSCPIGQVVLLSAGTFRIASGPIKINKGIVLRGAGPTLTHLTAPNGTNQAVVVIGHQWPKTNLSVNLTANAVRGSKSVTVASASGLAVGELVLIDALTNSAITKWSADSPPGDVSRGWFSRMDRPLSQMMEIASISGNTVTFTTPFHITFDMAHTAQLSRFVQWVGGPLLSAVKYAGLEDVHVYGGEGGDGGGNIRLQLAAYSWAKRVESEFSKGGSVAIYHAFRCVVRDSYLHHTKNPNPGGDGYGFSINQASADNLIENNISWNFNKVMVMRATGGGNVIGYNYLEDGYGAGYPTIVETGLNASHMTTPHHELFEGNQAFNIGADARWGNSVYITFFRNHATSIRRSLGGLNLSDIGDRKAISLGAGHYWYTFVGNVLGYSGMSPAPAGTSFTYEDTYPWSDNPVPMWRLGYPDSMGTPGINVDSQVAATTIRDGNFDYATNQVRWDNTPQAIPNSLYLTSKPAFFGSNPWPWVDPTGTTKLHTLPARARFDAGQPPPPDVTYVLSVAKAGTGTGTVTSSPAGISCGADCSEPYNSGTVVTLSQTATAGSTFTGWSGVCTGTGACQVTMNAAKSVTATFTLNSVANALTVTKAGTGSGTVTSSPAGISCGADCSQPYNAGTVVTLTKAATAGSTFTGWSGACTGTGTCQVTMSAAKSVTATFNLIPYPLTVIKAGTGSGTVASSPAGISCGADCSQPYNSGTVVTLSQVATAGSTFIGWSGACTGTGTCQVTISAAKSVTATFTPAPHTLTVTKAGAGSGTITSTPVGISCGADCSQAYKPGTVVTLSRVATAGSTFTGWSGACTGTGTCQVAMSAARSVTATFTLNKYTLSVAKAGTGSGTVTSSPAGISCGADCSESYNYGTVVTLSQAATAGSTFKGWSGACTGTGACQVTISAAKSVTATFAPASNTLTVTKAGTGSGTITSTPVGISCGSDCSQPYNPGTLVTLAKVATAGSTFTGWSGACTGTATCQVTISAAKSVTATFTLNKYTLTVAKAGTGTGTVTSSPAGISCGSDCSEPYNSGTVVTLSQAATAGSTFKGWSGACTGTGACQVTISAAKSVTATFAPAPNTLAVTKAGTGSGTVTSSPAGISCGADCSQPYNPGTLVTLGKVATAGSTFTGWSGACIGTGACQVTMSAANSVTATFTLNPTLTVTKVGSGSGTVASTPVGISCGADCSQPYNPGTVVTLTKAASARSTFTGWSGACTGTGACQVTMSAANSVTATFTLNPTLTVTKAGTGSGTVTSSPAGISCGADCSQPYNPASVVTLTKAATAGSTFTGWSGACTGTGTCQVTMSAASSVTATFTLNPTLTVSKRGSGSGTVTSTSAEITCGANCSQPYDPGTIVTLSPSAAIGSTFTGWSGACTGTGPCRINMIAAQTVSAIFTLDDARPALVVSDVRVTEGHVTSRNAVFRVILSAAALADVSVDWTTADLTAKAGEDYLPSGGTLTIRKGSRAGSVMVPVLGDRADERNEAFLISLSNAAGARIVDGKAQGVIWDDDGEKDTAIPIASLPYVAKRPGRYRLVGDLVFASTQGAAVTVATNGVLLDLDGHTLSGSRGDATEAFGVLSRNHSDITVQNGQVQGFLAGVFLVEPPPSAGASAFVVRNLRVHSSTYAGIWLEGRGNQVDACEVVGTGGSTVLDPGAGAVGITSVGPRPRLTQNQVHDTVASNGGNAFGIAADRAINGIVSGNLVKNSSSGAATGILVTETRQVSLTLNTLDTLDYGIMFTSGSRGACKGNIMTGVATPTIGVTCDP